MTASGELIVRQRVHVAAAFGPKAATSEDHVRCYRALGRAWSASAPRPLRQPPPAATALLLRPLISSAGTGPERAELDDQPLARRGTSQLERLAGGLERGGRSVAANDDSVDRLAAVHRCPLTRFLGRPAAVAVRLPAYGPAHVVFA